MKLQVMSTILANMLGSKNFSCGRRTAYIWPGTTTSMVRPCVAFKSECSAEELLGSRGNPDGVEKLGEGIFSRWNCTTEAFFLRRYHEVPQNL